MVFFLSVDEVGDFAALMWLVVDFCGIVDFRRVAPFFFSVSASVVDAIEARAAHTVLPLQPSPIALHPSPLLPSSARPS